MSGHEYSQVSTITCIYQVQSIMSNVRFSFVINYVSEHKLSHVGDASHTTHTTRVNWGSKLLKLIGWRHSSYFRWVPYIPGTTTWDSWCWTAESGRTARYYSNSITVSVRDVSHPREPCSRTLSRLRNLYPRSTQNTDVSFVNSSILV